jgi:DNA-binding IclR family transcriptional regulator
MVVRYFCCPPSRGAVADPHADDRVLYHSAILSIILCAATSYRKRAASVKAQSMKRSSSATSALAVSASVGAGAIRPVRSVDRALAILACLGQGNRRSIDLARALKLHKATVGRLLISLQRAGMVRRNDDGFYTVGPAVVALASRAIETHRTLLDVLRDPLRRVWQLTGETIGVHVRAGRNRVGVEELESPQPIKYRAGLGQRSLHAGAAGRILLAFLPPDERRQVLNGMRLVRFTDATITNLSDLEKQLERDRRRGYATSFGEAIPGVASLSVPVFDSTGKVVASVSVLGPQARLSPPVLRRYAQILLKEIPVIPHSVV